MASVAALAGCGRLGCQVTVCFGGYEALSIHGFECPANGSATAGSRTNACVLGKAAEGCMAVRALHAAIAAVRVQRHIK